MNTLQRPFSNVQLELLKVFKLNLTEENMTELKEILLDFKFRKLEEVLEKSVNEKAYTQQDFDNMSVQHNRTPYLSYRKDVEKRANL